MLLVVKFTPLSIAVRTARQSVYALAIDETEPFIMRRR